jgi:inorganic phosphate transporter, PiT family
MSTLTVLIALALVFNFLNGFHDSSNIVATIIFSRALPPRAVLWLIALAESAGPFIFGVAVAKAIGEGIVNPTSISNEVILAALISAIIWNLVTWLLGIPSSSSHALIGGLVGAVSVSVGTSFLILPGIAKILIALFASPFIGLGAGYLITKLVYFLVQNASMKINWVFKNAQIVTGVGLALSHGANDAQKTMGIITMGLIINNVQSEFIVPLWVIGLSSLAMALGTVMGGWRLIRTLGAKFYKIRPVHGLCTQLASAGVILGAALVGGPVSTTQVVSTAIMGVGSADRLNKVRWGVAGNILTAWLLTIPITALLSAGLYWLIKLIW